MTAILSMLRRNPIAALLAAAGLFAAIGAFDIAAHPASEHGLHTYKEYILTATLIPAVFVVLWVLSALHGLHETRLGGLGLRLAAVALMALLVDGVVTLASGTTDTAGPLYPIGMFATWIGIVLLAIGWHRARAFPRWVGPALAAGWFVAATPLRPAFLILSAVLLAVAVALRPASTGVLVAAEDAGIAA
jgi:hypothetical protein